MQQNSEMISHSQAPRRLCRDWDVAGISVPQLRTSLCNVATLTCCNVKECERVLEGMRTELGEKQQPGDSDVCSFV